MRGGDYLAALRVYEELEALEPDDPTWPERRAGAYHELGRREEELACLRRSLELLIDQGQVLAAIATCKLVLEIAPDDPATLDRLHLLYAEPVVAAQASGAEPPCADVAVPSDSDAPLAELELTEVIPESRAVRLGEGDGGGIAEIPLEGGGEPSALDGLCRTPLFGSLDVTTLHRLVSQVQVIRLPAGATLFREGDRANTLYVVVDGAVVPVAEGPPRTRMAVLEKGAFFGEIGLVTNQPRNASIEALVDTRLLAIERKVMWSLIRERGEVSKTLLRFLRERLVDRTLRTHPFFAPFSRADLDALAGRFRFLEIRDGAAVVEQGLASDGLFVLLAGSLVVVDAEHEKHLGRLEPGDVFGGIPIIRDAAAAASVSALGKCWVLALEADCLRGILAGRPGPKDDLIARLDAAGDGGPIV